MFFNLFKKSQRPSVPQHAVVIHLDAINLSVETYEKYDLITLEKQLVSTLQSTKAGEYDGSEALNTTTKLYLYGSDAEELFATIQPILKTNPLCQNARVIIRQGDPGAQQREVTIASGT